MLLNIFTYRDYLRSIHTVRLNTVVQLAESNVEYKLYNKSIINTEDKKVDNIHDELIKNILKDKIEFTEFINNFLELRSIVKAIELIKYSSMYIDRRKDKKETDIIYKLRNRDLFFLVKYRSVVDYKIPYVILSSCVEIIQNWIREKREKK